MSKSIDWKYWMAVSSLTIAELAHLLANEEPDEHLDALEKSDAFKKCYRLICRAIEDQRLDRVSSNDSARVDEMDRVSPDNFKGFLRENIDFVQSYNPCLWKEICDVTRSLSPKHLGLL